MKKGFFKKLLAGLLLAIGAFSLAGCETTEKTAEIKVNGSSYEISEVTQDSKKVKKLRLILLVENPTIYNATEFAISYQCFDTEGNAIPATSDPETSGSWTDYPIKMGVAHGVKGYVYAEFETFDNLGKVTLSNGKCTKYANIWDTYLVWWILAIVVAGVASVFYSVDLFARGLTAEELKQKFADNVGSSLVILALLLLICLIPLLFSSWVVTLIILGGYVGFLLVSGTATAVRIAIANKQ